MNDDVFRPGELCGTYRIVRLLGRGGFADVYQAIDVTNQQKVALKCLQLRHLTNARITQRMVAETELLAGLDHPNVVQVEDAGINGGVLWLAMEYLSGKTLRERLRAARGPLAPEVALYYARQIGEGVAAAHELNVVHRDLKPENIMITAKDEVKVLDLGAAKFFDRELTLSGAEGAIGTPLYMSPEQIKAEEVDVRADVYALGMILYEMLAGRHAFAQPNGELPPAFEIGTLQLHAKPKPLTDVGRGVPAAVWQLVEKAIAKDPADRFASMAQFARAIRATLRGVLESPGAAELWDEVMADPGPAPDALEGEEDRAEDRGAFESREAALKAKPEPSEEPAAPKVEPEENSKPSPPKNPELRSAPEAKETPRKKSSGSFVPNGGDEDDEEPHSGVRNIAALSPAAASEAPPPKPAPALARVVRIGPGGRQGEIVQAPEPAAANGEDLASAAAPAALVAPAITAAAPAALVAPAITAAALAIEEAPASAVTPPALSASTGAPGSEEPLVISAPAPAAGLEVAGSPGKLEAIVAPAPAVVSLWARLRSALRARSRAAFALVPMLGVLLLVALRPPAFIPFAHSAMPGAGMGPVLVAAASQPASEQPSGADPSLGSAPVGASKLPAADSAIPKPEDAAPPKPKAPTARLAHRPIQAAPPAPALTPASAEECGKLLLISSTPRCPNGKMASAAAPAGHGKL